MIDTETVKFIGELNRLAWRSENGIYPFSTATKDQMYGLLYDDRKPLREGGSAQLGDTTIVFDDCYPLIADCLIDNEHHDIISTYTQMYDADDIVIGVMTGAWMKKAKHGLQLLQKIIQTSTSLLKMVSGISLKSFLEYFMKSW